MNYIKARGLGYLPPGHLPGGLFSPPTPPGLPSPIGPLPALCLPGPLEHLLPRYLLRVI